MWKTLGKPFYITVILLLITIFFVYRAPHGKSMPLQQDFMDFPNQIGSWKGETSRMLDQKVLDILRVDHYLDRVYYNETGEWISLYIGYFQDQKDGETIHSPRNCMPGSGWNITQIQPVTIDIPGDSPLTINAIRALVVNGEEQLLTYYWYQSRGRFVTSEYWHKMSLVYDAIRYNRTDGALVRVLAPLPKHANTEQIDAQLKAFIAEFTPTLQFEYFPPAVG